MAEKKLQRIRSVMASEERRDQSAHRAAKPALYSIEVRQACWQELCLLEWSMVVGDDPVHLLYKHCSVYFTRIVFPGTGALSWWYIPSKSQYCLDLNSEQVP